MLIGLMLISFLAKAQETIVLDIEEQYRKGVALMNANQYAKALDYIFECQRSDAKNLDYQNRLGYCYFQMGNFLEAKYSFQATLKLDSTNITALSNLAAISERELNYRKAKAYYSELIELDSTNSYYHRQQALVAQKQSDIASAAIHFSKAHRLNERDLATINDLAVIYLELKAPEYARQVIDKGIAIDSNNIRVRYTNARVCNAFDDYAGVVGAIQGAMIQGDSTPYFQMMVGAAYLKMDSINRAIYHFTRLIDREKDSEHTHHYLALAYEVKEEIEKSTFHFGEAIKKGISKKVPRYHQDLAELYERKKQYGKAYEHYRAAHNYAPQNELLFLIAINADRYFKDKSIALRYYQKYASSRDEKYSTYARQRIDELIELLHQMKG